MAFAVPIFSEAFGFWTELSSWMCAQAQLGFDVYPPQKIPKRMILGFM